MSSVTQISIHYQNVTCNLKQPQCISWLFTRNEQHIHRLTCKMPYLFLFRDLISCFKKNLHTKKHSQLFIKHFSTLKQLGVYQGIQTTRLIIHSHWTKSANFICSLLFAALVLPMHSDWLNILSTWRGGYSRSFGSAGGLFLASSCTNTWWIGSGLVHSTCLN